MVKYLKKIKSQEDKLYNKILSLSRNKFLYTKLDLRDTFQNRIYLIFLHLSFVLINLKQKKLNLTNKKFYQNMFDISFKKIELNMREVGYGDIMVNKNMKFLVKIFYSILLSCENYKNKSYNGKNLFLTKYLVLNDSQKSINNINLVKYFDKYQAFCFDLTEDSVLKGDLNFSYK